MKSYKDIKYGGNKLLKSKYREPRYAYLLNQKLKSTLTKSKNLHFHLFLIEYDDPKEIPFNTIAEVSGVEPNKIRALLRSVSDPKTYLGLVDVGVDPRHIPKWYAQPKFVKKILKKAKARIVEEKKVPELRPEVFNVVSNPLNGINLPPTYGHNHISEQRTVYYIDDFYHERYLSPTEIRTWEIFIEHLREDDIRQSKYWEARRKLLNRVKRAPTFEELRAWFDIHQLNKTLQINMQFQEFLYWYPIYQQMFPPSITRAEAMEVIAGFKEIIDTQIRILYATKPTSVPVKVTPYIPPNNDNLFEQLREIKQTQDQQRISNLKAIAELLKDIQERKQLAKMARHGTLLNPLEAMWPPGYTPIEISPKR